MSKKIIIFCTICAVLAIGRINVCSLKNNVDKPVLQGCMKNGIEYARVEDKTDVVRGTSANDTTEMQIKYISLGIPNIDSSFKAFMSYRTITDKRSNQYKYISQNAWVDDHGFMRVESDIKKDDYYLIALGSYYGTEIGTKYRITTDNGNVFYGVLADCKANKHTNSTNQYTVVGTPNIVEFIVDTKRLNKDVKYHGSAGAYAPLSGNIVKIERIEV